MSEKIVRIVKLNDEKTYQRLIDGTEQSYGTKAGRVYLEAGDHCHEHSTEAREEILVFLSGQGTLKTGDAQEDAVGAGSVAYIPPHTLHDVQNTGTEPLIYIFCVTPVA